MKVKSYYIGFLLISLFVLSCSAEDDSGTSSPPPTSQQPTPTQLLKFLHPVSLVYLLQRIMRSVTKENLLMHQIVRLPSHGKLPQIQTAMTCR